MSNKNELYLITATTRSEGLVLSEIFQDVDEALYFEKNGVIRQLRTNYGESMANCDSLQIGFRPMKVHEVGE